MLNQLSTPFRVDFWSLVQGAGNYTCTLVLMYIQSIERVQEVLSLSQKVSRCAKVGQTQYLFQTQNWLWEQEIYCSSYLGSIILWLPSIHHINICWKPWYPRKEVMNEVNQPQTWLHLAIWKQSLRNTLSSFTDT